MIKLMLAGVFDVVRVKLQVNTKVVMLGRYNSSRGA